MSVLNDRSVVATFDPMTRSVPNTEFSSYFFYNCRWSPDGQRLVGEYSGLNSGSNTAERKPDGIVIVDTDGREIWHRSGSVDFQSITLSPKADNIAFQGKGGLFTISVVTSSIDFLDRAAASDYAGPGSIAWSPDSNEIVYEHAGQIMIFDIRVRTSRKLTDGAQPTWSPDGRWIAYISPEKDGILISSSGTEKRKVVIGKTLEDPLRWSPDSEYLLYTQPDSANVFYRLTELKDRLVIYRVGDGAEFVVISGVPKGVGWRYQWVVRRSRAR